MPQYLSERLKYAQYADGEGLADGRRLRGLRGFRRRGRGALGRWCLGLGRRLGLYGAGREAYRARMTRCCSGLNIMPVSERLRRRGLLLGRRLALGALSCRRSCRRSRRAVLPRRGLSGRRGISLAPA